MDHKIRVVLADDHGIVRRGIREFLDEPDDIEVVAEAEDGQQALDLIAQHQPDLVMLDIQMPKLNGLDAARQIRQQYQHQIGILILTAYNDPPYIRAALEAGANGYIMKSADADDLTAAVRDVYEGRSVVTASLINRSRAPIEPADMEYLTDREREILMLAAQGLTNKAIGFQLDISNRTVQGHLAHIYQKLGVSGRTEAALKAIQSGLITVMS